MMQWSEIREDIQKGLITKPEEVRKYALLQLVFWKEMLDWAEKMRSMKN